MHPSLFFFKFAAWLTLTSAFTGFVTFNDYAQQVANGGTPACGADVDWHDHPDLNLYAAAAQDGQNDLFAGSCNYSHLDDIMDPSQCQGPANPYGHNPSAGYPSPSCTNSKCNTCFNVTSGTTSITVKIIDACPMKSAWNYCKTEVTAAGKCAASGNHLDISTGAQSVLNGGSAGEIPSVDIESVQCPTGRKREVFHA